MLRNLKKVSAVALMLSTLALAGVCAPVASAAPEAGPGWSYKSSFGEFPASQSEPPRSPVGVDGSGNIFAATDQGNLDWTIRIFSPTAEGGTQLTEFSTGCCSRNIAVDPSGEVMYADSTNTWGESIKRYVSDGAPTPTFSMDPAFDVPKHAGLAIDPTTGNLLVADPGAEAVLRYDDTGTLLATIATPSISPSWIVTAPDGSFFVAPVGGPDITHFSGTGTLLGTISAVGTLHGLAYDAAHALVVAAVGETLKSYSEAGVLRSESPAHSTTGTGLAAGGSGRLYELDGSNLNLYVSATAPGVEAPQVGDVAPHSVHLSAEVDPGEEPGGDPPAGSFARFEYSADGGQSWVAMPAHELSDPGLTTVEDDLDGLKPKFDYLVRFVAGNSLVSRVVSSAVPVHTLSSAPEIETTAATDLTETSAVLKGTINPAGLQSSYHFEYGTTASYGSRIPVAIEAVTDSTYDTRIYGRTITGLTPGTTYHFRIVAQNSAGTSFGDDRTFTTPAVGAVPHRAYEQVTPVDKQGRQLNPRFGFQVKPDGSAFAYNSLSSQVGAPLLNFTVSHREGGDWHPDTDLAVPLPVDAAQAERPVILTTTLAISEDMTRQMVATTARLTPDAGVEGGANLYMQDLATGAYTYIGGNPETYWPAGIGPFIWDSYGAGVIVASAPDLSWVVFQATSPLIAGTPGDALYRWSEEDGLELVSVVPGEGAQAVTLIGPTRAFLRSVSSDGSRIYFRTTPGGGLYLREGDDPAKPVSVSHIAGDDPTAVKHTAAYLGASKDGRYAFFSAEDPLTDDAVGKSGNVYRYDAVSDSLDFIDASGIYQEVFSAIGVSEDGETAYFRGNVSVDIGGGEEGIETRSFVWHNGAVSHPSPTSLEGSFSLVLMSPDGRYLAWEDSGDVYVYDADADTRSCASCLADGTPGEARLPLIQRGVGNHEVRAVTDAGQVFFSAYGRLVAADSNGKSDVYMYQDGRNTLISPGNAPYDAIFSEATADGSNVFFSTNQKLVGQDNDGAPDIYDARIGGGLAAQNPPPPQECLRDDCKETPNAGPELPFGGSEALSGPGNVTPAKHKKCGKGKRAKKVKGKVRCVKKHAKHQAGKNKKGGNR